MATPNENSIPKPNPKQARAEALKARFYTRLHSQSHGQEPDGAGETGSLPGGSNTILVDKPGHRQSPWKTENRHIAKLLVQALLNPGKHVPGIAVVTI